MYIQVLARSAPLPPPLLPMLTTHFFLRLNLNKSQLRLPEMQGSSLFCVPEDFFFAPCKTQQALRSYKENVIVFLIWKQAVSLLCLSAMEMSEADICL